MISRSEVSRICTGLDEQVEAFRTRPLEGAYPDLFLDAKVEKVRDGGRVVPKALVIAHGVHETGRREILRSTCGRPRPKRSGPTSCAAWSPAG
jgi:putative transposase